MSDDARTPAQATGAEDQVPWAPVTFRRYITLAVTLFLILIAAVTLGHTLVV